MAVTQGAVAGRHRSKVAEARRYGRLYAHRVGVPCTRLATLKRRSPRAAFQRWGIPNALGPCFFGVACATLYVDDDADGAPRLVVIP
jgi:hypothetical protein